WICLIAGLVAGLLMGFNGFMWSQAVIVEVYTLSVLSLMGVLCCLLRWMYAPHQRRYLYWAFFLFGICFTNHQSLLVAAVGIEVAILAADRRLGRDLFLGNSIVFLFSLLAKAKGWVALFEGNAPMFYIYLAIGLGSILAFIWAAINTDMELSPEAFVKRSGPVVLLGALWGLGAAFYLYMPASSMSNPPMNWGYSRTVEGFFHALSRGQYDKTNPINILGEPKRLVEGFGFLKDGLIEEFAPACLILAVLPFIYLRRMASRERGWLTGLIAIYFCLGVILLLLLNPSPDRMSRELHKVFFTASHVMIAMFIGYGLSIIAAMMITQYQKFRQWFLTGGAIASALGLYIVVVTFSSDRGVAPEATNIFSALFNLVTISVEPSQDWTLQMAAVIGLVLPALWTALVLLNRTTMTMVPMLVVMAALPVQSIMNHWSNNEQRGHLFGYWFGHDMFTPPYDVYPKMAPHAVVFGGTDPGRFNPTYMIFCESFVKPEQRRNPEFDRRDCYLITQNALADGTYLSYIRAHYNRSTQIDPPFFQELVRSKREKEINVRTNLLSKMLRPLDNVLLGLGDDIEKNRRAGSSFFKPEDFTDLNALASRLKAPKAEDLVAVYLASKLSDSTRGLLGDAANESKLRKSLAADLNRLLEEDLANRKKLAALDDQRQSLLTASNKEADPQILSIDKERASILATGLIYETDR
ncbi:MAG TPA: DUF2723 domain-containing protein, partial [Roseimicrobium sp.]|nr:DUF2723 domain-containing protein [Roseimicrobium sp.]